MRSAPTCAISSFAPRCSSASVPRCASRHGRPESRPLLHEIEDHGLFLVPLDEERHWYRYHRLFAEFLQQQLSELDPRARDDVYLRASYWFRDEDLPIEAIEYAKKAGTTLLEADLLERLCEETNYIGRVGLVSKYADQLPQNILCRYPNLLLTLAWRLSRSMRFKEAAEFIASARVRLQELEGDGEMPPKDLRRLRYLLQHREMVLAWALDDMAVVEESCQRLLTEYPDEPHPYLRGTIYSHLLVAQREQFKFVDYERLAATASGVLRRSIYGQSSVGLQAGIGPTLFANRSDRPGPAHPEQGRRRACAIGRRTPQPPRRAAWRWARWSTRTTNSISRAGWSPPICRAACGSGFIDQLQSGFVTLARIRAARGDLKVALSTLDEGMAIAIERNLERAAPGVDGGEDPVAHPGGNVDKARAQAEAEGVSLDGPAAMPGTGSTTRDEQRAIIWVRLAQAMDQSFPAIAVVRAGARSARRAVRCAR